MPLNDWIATAVELNEQHLPGIEPHIALAIAEELHDAWPGLTPHEAVHAYWEAPLTA